MGPPAFIRQEGDVSLIEAAAIYLSKEYENNKQNLKILKLTLTVCV